MDFFFLVHVHVCTVGAFNILFMVGVYTLGSTPISQDRDTWLQLHVFHRNLTTNYFPQWSPLYYCYACTACLCCVSGMVSRVAQG